MDSFRFTFPVSAGQPIASATVYEVHLAGDVESMAGDRHTIDLRWDAMTSRPSVHVEPRRTWRGSRQGAFAIDISHAVTESALRNALRVTAR